MDLGIGGLGHATEIGAGASAVVYKALQVDLDREVAVKVLSATDEAFVRRFHREAKTLGKLSLNPGIVTVHGTGVTESGHPYLILELCDSSVLDHLKSNGRFEPAEACRVGAQVADAVSDAHSNGVIHRDIKPGNLLRSQNGRYLITDFGIATVRGSTLGQTDSIGFTAGYVAPETLRGEEAGTPADVYALGATLFHMLSGYPPFVDQTGNGNLLALAQRVINDPIPDLRPYGVPDDVCRIVEGAMAKYPADRPSAAQLRDQLQALVGGGRGAISSLPPQRRPQPNPAISDPIHPAAPRPEPTAVDGAEPVQADVRANVQVDVDTTVAVSEIGADVARTIEGGSGPTSFGSGSAPPPPVNRSGSAGRASGILDGADTAAVPPSHTEYPLPLHSDGPEPWKLVMLGVGAAAILVLGAVVFAVTRSGNPDGLETTAESPEGPDADQQDAGGSGSSADDDGGSQSGLLPDQESTTTTEVEKTVSVPNVLGLSEGAASRRLIDDGLVVKVEERPSADAPVGTVVGQSPTGGTPVDTGSIATIFVAVAPDAVVADVPVVSGMTETEAVAALASAGFEVSDPSLVFSERPEGQVIGSDPAGGTSADTAVPVTLVISRGPQPPTCAELIGLTEADATDLVEAANLTVTSSRQENETTPEDEVIECESSGSGFTLVISDGPEICGVVIGMLRPAGTSALEAKGYTVTANAELRTDLPVGQIFDCAKQGSTATIGYATGLPSECPASAIGATVAEARAALTAAGFTDVTISRISDDTVAADRVISCEVSGSSVTMTVSTGPDTQTGKLTVKVTRLEVTAPCAGDRLRPDLYGTISVTYDGVRRNIWLNVPPDEAETPNVGGRLGINESQSWSDVPVGQDLIMTWDLSDSDVEGRAGDEDGDDDRVSSASRQITLSGADRDWAPGSDSNDECKLTFEVEATWSGLDN